MSRSVKPISRCLVEEHYRKLVRPRSIICIKEGLAFFRAADPTLGAASRKLFEIKKEKASRIVSLYGISLDMELPPSAAEKNKLWREVIRPRLQEVKECLKYETVIEDFSLPSDASREEIDRLLSDLRKKRSQHLRAQKERQKQKELAFEEMERKRLGIGGAADVKTASLLHENSSSAMRGALRDSRTYLYLKVWSMSDGKKWYKIGVTNNLARRDSEQNVLPVPAETICHATFPNIDVAYAVEKVFHGVLMSSRIRGANNKELFMLEPEQVAAVVEIMGKINIDIESLVP